ncbi:unnamed protein product [Strongylus vulgaris]|uniref:Uncharacterized protein n=1 Tax=Strongylus vulgaris TaxID=40348 RepID=A0A3P7I236_STRVU|nr:unnamed protein product [Strongylus vulgaris]
MRVAVPIPDNDHMFAQYCVLFLLVYGRVNEMFAGMACKHCRSQMRLRSQAAGVRVRRFCSCENLGEDAFDAWPRLWKGVFPLAELLGELKSVIIFPMLMNCEMMRETNDLKKVRRC